MQDLGVDLAFPKDGEVLTLRVILQAGKMNEGLFPSRFARGFDCFHQIAATANFYDLAR